MRTRLLLLLFFICCTLSISAQIGGRTTFNFLALPSSARATAMGGSYISCIDKDVSLSIQNPAALYPELSKQASFGTVAYLGGINYGHLAYAHALKKYLTLCGSFQYISYGKIARTDEAANQYGTFNPNEFSMQIGAGYQFGKHYSVGSNLKMIVSNLETYHSSGAALDLAVAYNDTARKMSATLLVRDIGLQFNPYVQGSKRDPLPFDIQLGFSKRFKFVPFRLSIIVHDLYRWDLKYNDPASAQTANVFTDSSSIKQPKQYIFDKFAQHFIIGGEIYIGKPLRLSFAYNHQNRQAHAFDNKKSLAGFSFGLGLHIKQFDVSYGLQIFAKNFFAHHITISVATGSFVKKKSAPKV